MSKPSGTRPAWPTLHWRLLVLLAGATGTVNAGADGWEASALVTGGYAAVDRITDHGTIASGQVILGILEQLSERETTDTVAGIGFAVSRTWGNLELEVETVWRYRTDWDLTIPTPSIRTVTNVFTNVETTSVLLNVIHTRALRGRWSLELGGGGGFARNVMASEYREREDFFPAASFEDENTRTDVAWNVLAGVSRDLSDGWSLSIRYRYIDLGRVTSGPFTSRPGIVSGDHQSHELLLRFTRAL